MDICDDDNVDFECVLDMIGRKRVAGLIAQVLSFFPQPRPLHSGLAGLLCVHPLLHFFLGFVIGPWVYARADGPTLRVGVAFDGRSGLWSSKAKLSHKKEDCSSVLLGKKSVGC